MLNTGSPSHDQRSSKLRRRSVAPLALAAAALCVAPPARAALLDEPPKLYTFKLDDPSATRLSLLESFHEANVERSAATFGVYAKGSWSGWRQSPWWSLAWQPSFVTSTAPAEYDAPPREAASLADDSTSARGEDALGAAGIFELPKVELPWLDRTRAGGAGLFTSTGTSFASNGFDALWAPAPKPLPWWKCRRKAVTFVRFGAESDSFKLLQCDGAVAPEALDRLTLIARPNGIPRPGDLLPDEPDAEASRGGEWLPGVRLVHPRLLWALQRIADAFPWKAVYVYSGYRPAPEGAAPSSHQSRHASGRAMDIHLMGVPNAELFKICHKLDDVGCGYYPNSKFVHVDVRPGTGHPFWIDASGPGEPSRFVDGWPGVIDNGGLSWDARALAEVDAGAPAAPGKTQDGTVPCASTGGAE